MAKKKKPASAPLSNTSQPATCIIPGLLYLGPVSAASNSAFLARERITHVISVGRNPFFRVDGVVYERLNLTDEEDSVITFVSARACEIIDNAAAAGDRVLVHCAAGISRSPAMIIVYLMKQRGMTLRQSLEMVVRARPVVAPNPGFLKQLCEMERELFDGESTFNPEGITSKTRLSGILGIR